MPTTRVIAVDFDGTASANPEAVQKLYENPFNFIVIHTARSSAIRAETVEQLRILKIPYHALVMDKLRADVYVDDRNVGGLQWPE